MMPAAPAVRPVHEIHPNSYRKYPRAEKNGAVHNSIMAGANSGQRTLERMIRRTMEAISKSEILLEQTRTLVKRSEAICASEIRLPNNDIDQSVR